MNDELSSFFMDEEVFWAAAIPLSREIRCEASADDNRWSGRRGDASDEDQVERNERELPGDDQYYGVELSADALDAHRQVLEMASTIDILTRDFENQQQELLHAYKKLREYVGKEPKSPTERSAARKLFRRDGGGNDDDDDDDGEDVFEHSGGCCSHQDELHELRKLVDVKDTALTEALNQRNEYRVQLEKAEALIKEFRSMHLQGGGDGGRVGWKVHPTGSSMGGYYASGMATPCTQGSLAPGGTGTSSGSASMMLGCNGAIEVPRNERFDHESTYQRKENDELFWRKQYKEAVRMRKKYGLVNPTASAGNNNSSNHAAAGHHYHQHLQQQQQGNGNGNGNSAPRPSLKIFSYPDHRRQKGIKDENVPFSRYIGISTRQHEIIKEQHRMLA